jgi:hypothetical protein
MNDAAGVIAALRQAGVRVRAVEGSVGLYPPEKVARDVLAWVREHKAAILNELQAEGGEPMFPADPQSPAGTLEYPARAPAAEAPTAPRLSVWAVKGDRYCFACGGELEERQPYLMRKGEVDEPTQRGSLLERARELLEKLPNVALGVVVTNLQSMTHNSGVRLQ